MRRLLSISVTMVLIGGLAGCGGSDDGDAGGAGGTTTSGPTVTRAMTTVTSSSTDDISPANCPELAEMIGNANFAAAGLAGVSGSPATISADFLQEVADRAPAEIRADFQIIADAAAAFFEAAEKAGIDFNDPMSFAGLDQAAIEDLEQAGEIWESDEVRAAEAKVQSFFERECS